MSENKKQPKPKQTPKKPKPKPKGDLDDYIFKNENTKTHSER
ncbi:MAG: hypothetical protein PHF89_07780 [Eubacteriales bacterium]|jgi:hypothetical protein|nr:hypothetical protein [Eubacteriales bacterium]